MIWPRTRLDECTRIVSGATPKTGIPEFWDGDICWVTPKDLSALEGLFIDITPRRITARGLTSCAAEVLPAGSVLFSSRAPIGHVAINRVPMATNQGFKSFIPKASKLNAGFLFWWLKCHRPYLEGLGNGATFKELSKSVVARIEIPLPPLDEQQRIAAVLDLADELRRKRRQALKRAESLVQSLFVDFFGDPIRNPKDSNIVRLADVTTRITDGVHQKPTYRDDGVPFISVKNITTGVLRFDDCKFVSREDHEKFTKRCRPEPGDILYTKVGATYGRPALVDKDEEFSLYVSVCLIKPRRELIEPKFLCAVLGLPAVKVQADRRIKGIGVPDLHLDQIREFLIPLPPLSEQREFSAQIGAVERVIASQQISLAKFDDLFTSLQHRAFRGELPLGSAARADAELEMVG
jgi:type I restriction enzyme, S subunit